MTFPVQIILKTMQESKNQPGSGALAVEINAALQREELINKAMLLGDLHNGFNFGALGDPREIDVIKSLLIPHILVKSLRVFQNNEYTSKLNYTQLTELRKELEK